MIEVFKILTGKYDAAAAPVMDIYDLKTTRENDFKLNKIWRDLKLYDTTDLALASGSHDLVET